MNETIEHIFSAETALSTFEQFGGRAELDERHGPNGVHVYFDNEWVVSIQWGRGNYCDNRDLLIDRRSPAPPSATAEVACWKGQLGKMMEFDNDCVKGWCSWAQVRRLLEMASKDAVIEPIDLGPDESRRECGRDGS